MLEIYSVFYYAKRHSVSFSEIVFNKKYDVSSKLNPPIWHYNYIASNIAIFKNIANHFIDDHEFKDIKFYQC
jgi:hypothetical protein